MGTLQDKRGSQRKMIGTWTRNGNVWISDQTGNVKIIKEMTELGECRKIQEDEACD